MPEPQPTSRAPAAVPRPAATPYTPPAKAPVPVPTAPQYHAPPVATGVVPQLRRPSSAPPVLPDRDGTPVPPGYHLEKHRWSGLILGGSVTFGDKPTPMPSPAQPPTASAMAKAGSSCR